jgi:hypothetical protein
MGIPQDRETRRLHKTLDSARAPHTSADGFEMAFKELIDDQDKMINLGRLGFERMRLFEGAVMEKKEADIILSLTGSLAS